MILVDLEKKVITDHILRLDAIRREVSVLQAQIHAAYQGEGEFMNWQPIETAPKDGQEIIVKFAQQGNVKQLIYFDKIHGYWASKGQAIPCLQATHWLPILGDDNGAGMYAMHDPAYHQVAVGQFTICRQDNNSIWIQRQDGEGAQFSDSLFESAIKEFYEKHF